MAYPPADPAVNKANATAAEDDHPAHHNALGQAVIDIVDELGDDPSGGSVTVQARLATLAQITSTLPFTWVTGDEIYYGGTYEAA